MMLNIVLLNGFFHKIWEWLNAWDTYLFLKMNTVWTNPVFDSILPWWRDSNTWTPLYLFLIVFAVMNFRSKSFYWILGAVITLILTDQISSTFIKSYFARLRPCNEPALIGHMRLLLPNCAGGYSFTSSHATNHFGFTMYVLFTLRSIIKKWGYAFIFWAVSVGYAQIYVGVHYPLDILSGTILGSCIGYTTSHFFNRWMAPLVPESININQ